MTTETVDGGGQVDELERVDELEAPARRPWHRDPQILLGAAVVVAGLILWSSRPRRGGQPIYLAKPCRGCGGGTARQVEPVDGQHFTDASTGEAVVYHDGHVGPAAAAPSSPQPAEPGAPGPVTPPVPPAPAQDGSAVPDDQHPVSPAVDPQARVVVEPADRGLNQLEVQVP